MQKSPETKQESDDEVLSLAGFFDLLAKFDFEDKQKEKLTEQISQTPAVRASGQPALQNPKEI